MRTHRLTSTLALAGGAVLIVSGCSSGYAALETRSAVVLINGTDIGERLPIRCEQVKWDWYIETLEETPGFVAQVQSGDTVFARGVQIERLGGFTGSFWDGTVGRADAEFVDGVVEVMGVAQGYYHRDPSEDATAEFAIRSDC